MVLEMQLELQTQRKLRVQQAALWAQAPGGGPEGASWSTRGRPIQLDREATGWSEETTTCRIDEKTTSWIEEQAGPEDARWIEPTSRRRQLDRELASWIEEKTTSWSEEKTGPEDARWIQPTSRQTHRRQIAAPAGSSWTPLDPAGRPQTLNPRRASGIQKAPGGSGGSQKAPGGSSGHQWDPEATGEAPLQRRAAAATRVAAVVGPPAPMGRRRQRRRRRWRWPFPQTRSRRRRRGVVKTRGGDGPPRCRRRRGGGGGRGPF